MSESWLQQQARKFVFQALGRLRYGRLTIATRYGHEKSEEVTFGEHSASESDLGIVVVFKNPQAWVRICQAFELGLAESYMLQDVECDDLVGLFELYISNQEHLGYSGGNIMVQLVPRLSRYLTPANDAAHALKNASFHYDTSNTHFSNFLSSDMNYSSALWSGEPDESLESAQSRKIQNIIDKAQLSSSDHVLDIGCGWGNFAMEAAKQTGCRLTGITLSVEQQSLAEEKIKEAGLQDRVTILLCDYRQAPKPDGGYDRVVSIEMLEHVGSKYMNQYFESISALLKPAGGIMVIQGITTIHVVNISKPQMETFFDRYIFPGGYFPTINQLLSSIHAGSNGTLEVESVQNIGPHYIRTLQCWREKFTRNWDSIRTDFASKHQNATDDEIEAYRRTWTYYFQCCEAGFRKRILGDYVISAVRTPWPEIPANVPH